MKREQCHRCKKWLRPLAVASGVPYSRQAKGDGRGYRKHVCIDTPGGAFMKCEICKRGMADDVTLYRVNPKGVLGIWRCWDDMTAQQRAATDPEIKELAGVLEGE